MAVKCDLADSASCIAVAGKRVEYRDSVVPQLRVRVSETSRSYSFFWRVKGGRAVRKTLGTSESISVEDARARAREMAGFTSQGIAPVEAGRDVDKGVMEAVVVVCAYLRRSGQSARTVVIDSLVEALAYTDGRPSDGEIF